MLNEAMTIEPSNERIKQKLMFCRGCVYLDSKAYKEALKDFKKIPATSDMHERIEEMRKICIEQIAEHDQKLNEIRQKARRSTLAKVKTNQSEKD